jgi:hypothetical protein
MTNAKSSPAGPPPEVELLLACARTHLEESAAARLNRLLAGPLDWERMLRLARGHGVLPLLARHLGAAPPGLVPATTREALAEEFRRGARRSFALTGELLRILNRLAVAGLTVVPYKGPALAADAYGDLALRPFADLDIMVREAEVGRARELLAPEGYLPDYSLAPRQERACLRTTHALGFHRAAGQVALEVHWQFLPRHFAFALDPTVLEGRLVPVSLCGHRVLTYAPEDLLLILCAHGAKHVWEVLRMVCDISQLLQAHADLNWDRVTGAAGDLGARRILFTGLALAHRLLGSQLPPQVEAQAAADPAVGTLVEAIRAGYFRGEAGPPPALAAARFQLAVRERYRDRLQYLLGLAAPTVADCAALPLPAPLFPLYYLLRPFRLAGRHRRR